MNSGDRNQFGKFITALRGQQKVPLDRLCNGLCSISMITRIGNGERMPGKLLLSRLLSRLGVAPDAYENFLPSEDYKNWKARQQILRLIMVRDMDGAKRALEAYRKEFDMGDKLEKQFYLSMQVQLDRMGGATDEELREKFRETVLLTVPEVEKKSVKEMLLSVQELNLVLEYERYQQPEDLEQRYWEMLEYIESSTLDTLSKAKIYPKIVFYLYQYLLEKTGTGLSARGRNQILVLCNKALRMLQESMRIYYLCEILCIRRDMLQGMMEELSGKGEPWKASALEPMRKETEECLEMFGVLYEKCQIPKEMYEYCYLYVEKEVYCISNVIRTRRKMLGMTQKELAENICSEKTLTRLEKKGAKTQREIIEELFVRLKLPAEYCKKELVTDDNEVLCLIKELYKYDNERDFEKVEELTKYLEGAVSMDIPSNKQFIERVRVSNEWDKGNISREEYIRQMQEVLEITLPSDAIFRVREKYMTKMERMCIQNLLLAGNDMIQKYSKVLCEEYESYERENILSSFISIYEIMMDRIAGCLGDMGDYSQSNAISQKVIMECLLNKRAYMLDSCIYNIFWNNEQCRKEGIPLKKEEDHNMNLYYCILNSRFCKMKYSEFFYRREVKKEKK